MPYFLDVRLADVGGGLATGVAVMDWNPPAPYRSATTDQMEQAVRGRNVLIATHGFNVNRAAGIQSLTHWEALLSIRTVPPADFDVFVGLLWPGDSVWAHGLDYPEEPRIANETGQLIAPFIDAHFAGAASVSFASHSLGARVLLETVERLDLRVRRAILMAGAIDDNCLSSEFKAAAAKIERISVLASKEDKVLSMAFPLGNFISGIIAEGHPWWRAALGHCGPARARPTAFRPPYEIPKTWDYDHGDYLDVPVPPPAMIAVPTDVPPPGTPVPPAAPAGWKAAWSASFASTRFE